MLFHCMIVKRSKHKMDRSMRSIQNFLLLVLLAGSVLPAGAQMPPPPPPPPIPQELKNGDASEPVDAAVAAKLNITNVSPEKKALILEYVRLSGGHPDYGPELTRMMGLVQKQMPALTAGIVPTVLDSKNLANFTDLPEGFKMPSLTDAQKEQISADAQRTVTRLTTRTADLMTENRELPVVLEAALVRVYDKYFNEDDLKQMIAFYHTPVGQKLSQAQSAIADDLLTLTMSDTRNPMVQIIQQVGKEGLFFPPKKVLPAK